jgi:hypothetical protein
LKVGISFRPSTYTLFSAFSDENLVGYLDDRRSTGCLSSLLVQTLSLEVPENMPQGHVPAEYKSLANATAELIWVETLLGELGVMMNEMSCIWCDNLRATYLYANPFVHARI